MWNSNQQSLGNEDSYDSWLLVRAFEEDINNPMGVTWPPCLYTCIFCTCRFRSAQALDGHMNVHRLHHARLLQMPSLASSTVTTSTAAVIMNHQELVANGGVCSLIYYLPHPNPVFSPSTLDHCIESSSEFVSPHSTSTNFTPYSFPPWCINFPVPLSVNSSVGHSSITEHSAAAISDDYNDGCHIRTKKDFDEMENESDLELRLGCGSLGDN